MKIYFVRSNKTRNNFYSFSKLKLFSSWDGIKIIFHEQNFEFRFILIYIHFLN